MEYLIWPLSNHNSECHIYPPPSDKILDNISPRLLLRSGVDCYQIDPQIFLVWSTSLFSSFIKNSTIFNFFQLSICFSYSNALIIQTVVILTVFAASYWLLAKIMHPNQVVHKSYWPLTTLRFLFVVFHLNLLWI